MSSSRHVSIPYPGSMAGEHCMVTAFLRNIFARCAEGKKDAGITIFYTIADARAQHEQLKAGIPAELSYAHLEAIERTVTDAEFRYVFVSRENRPALFLYFQVYTVGSQNFNTGINRSFVRNIVNLFLDLKRARVLVAGNAMRNGAIPYCYDSSLLRPADVMDALASVAERLAESDGAAAVILPDLSEARNADLKMLERMGYLMPWEDTVMEMEVSPKWNTLQDYISDLSRKYKARANKILAGMEGVNVMPLTQAGITKYSAAISKLYMQVVDRQPFTLSTCGAAYLLAMKQQMGDDFEIYGYFKDKHLAGFSSGIVSPDSYEVYYVGFDEAAAGEHPLYFHMLLAGLERAILLRKPVLKLGRTSLDAKASLGAAPVITGYRIKLRHVPDVAVKWFTKYFSAAEDSKWKLRSPLKAEGVGKLRSEGVKE